MTTIQTQQLVANGVKFTARSSGDGPLVFCLHGFPDSAQTWDNLLPELAAAGFRAFAPFMRGYAPTEVPDDGDYAIATLALDIIALADALGVREFYVVGHDWGAITAYAVAAYAPGRVLGICTAAVPPLWRFLCNTSLAQIKRSWYIGFFQLPYFPEHALGKNHGALVDKLWRDWSPQWDYTAADIAPVKSIFGQSESCQAALGYYRDLPRVLTDPRRQRERKRLFAVLNVPALIIRGEQDGCIGTRSFAGAETGFSGPCELYAIDAGHFMHREQPQAFNQKLLQFLTNLSAR